MRNRVVSPTTPPLSESFRQALTGRYALQRELGSGGMAVVYLAHDVRHDRPVAIKLLRGEVAASIGTERFLQEMRTTARLQHPHILPLLGSGEADGRLY
jgi:serine/threonine-protein kinase